MDVYNDFLSKIREDKNRYNEVMPSGASADEIDLIVSKSIEFLKYNIDSEYLEFLKCCNGLDCNGYMIYSASSKDKIGNFLLSNLEWRNFSGNFDYIFFSESGDDLFCQNKDGCYLMDRTSGSIFKNYKSVKDLLIDVMKRMLDDFSGDETP